MGRFKKLRWKSLLLQLALVVIVYAGVQAWHTRETPSGKIPAFSGTLLDGRQVRVPQEIDKPTLVHFWATWCSICRLEQGSVNNVAANHPVIAIASQSGSATAVAKIVNERSITVPVLVDESGELAQRFGVKAFPTTFVIDANGVIRSTEVGFTTELGLRWRLWLASLR